MTRFVLNKRLVLVTGKGGVGRTTMVAALAIAAAHAGRRPLITEIKEPAMPIASPLGRIFGRDHLPDRPRHIASGIDGVQLQSELGTELFLGSVLRVPALAALAMRTKALLRLLHAGPSFFEMGLFYHLLSLLRAKDGAGKPLHDTLFLDMPATGHALALTTLPDIILRLVSRGPMADAMREGKRIVGDPAQSAAIVVTLPETLPVTESIELTEGLRQSGVPVAGLVLNKWPAVSFSEEERAALEAMLATRDVLGGSELKRVARADIARSRLCRSIDLPVVVVPERQLDGRALVDAIAHDLYADARKKP